jgi:Polyribonucleotide nucleotidyltransferase (polynucleotide phosphorylase)
MPRGPKRREIGHGNLAKRAIKGVLPDFECFWLHCASSF